MQQAGGVRQRHALHRVLIDGQQLIPHMDLSVLVRNATWKQEELLVWSAHLSTSPLTLHQSAYGDRLGDVLAASQRDAQQSSLRLQPHCEDDLVQAAAAALAAGTGR